MPGSRRDIWKEILDRFDPDLVTHPAWRADRDDSPAGKMITSLDRPTSSPPSVLLSDTIGIGKSTELFRIAEARAQKGDELVIVLELVRHFRRVVGDLEISAKPFAALDERAHSATAQDLPPGACNVHS